MIPTIHHSKAFVRTFRKSSGVTLCVVLMALQIQTTANQRVIQTETLLSNLRYEIELKLDYRNAAFTGTETVRFTNSGREDLDHLNFHLYPNVGLTDEDESWLSIRRVTTNGANGRELRSTLRARQTMVRVELPSKLAAGQSLELKLEFSGRVPQVQREEASLLAHFLQEVSDAVSEERTSRDARDIFFAGEESMLLGYFYPILAVRPSQLSEQSLVAGASGITVSEVAAYEVKVTIADGPTVIGSAPLLETIQSNEGEKRTTYLFKGYNLRGFGLAIAERMKSVEQQVDATRVVSYFREGDDRLGKRALDVAVHAVETYSQSFGAYPYPLLQIIEMPLSAGHSSSELSSLIVLAQAYYIDFDSIKSSRLPSFLREQADVIKTSFEFSLAHGVARQWWGVAVGSDSERFPYLDEALSSYSAAYYHEAAYGKGLGDIILKQQLHGTYQAYRMLGGADMEVDKPAREFRNGLQFTAIVQAKGAILFSLLRRELGDKKFFEALKTYYSANRFRMATGDQLRASFINATEDPRNVRALFQRWLKEKHGDEDIGSPDLTLVSPSVSKIRALGRVFVKIGKTAAKPF